MFSRKPGLSHLALSPSPLTRVIAIHLAQAAAIAMLIQTALCLAENFLDADYYSRWFVTTEVDRIAASLTPTSGEPRLKADTLPSHYTAQRSNAYAFRVLDHTGATIAASNVALLERVSPLPPATKIHLDTWHDRFDEQGGAHAFHVVGGARRMIGGKPVWIEVATLGDPYRQRYLGLWNDFVQDVLIPQVPTILLTASIAVFTVSRALRPLASVAEGLGALRLVGTDVRVETRGLPGEVAELADSVNILLARYASLVTAQDQFIANAAHQLRMPLAVIMLELGKLHGDGARLLEADVAAMSDTLDRLLELARMQSGSDIAFSRIEPEIIVRELAERLRPLASAKSSTIEVDACDPVAFEGDLVSFREAVRNLVCNAIHHTQDGARIRVTCGPDASVTVEDDGPGLGPAATAPLFQPFVRGGSNRAGKGLGLAIVRQAALLHGGTVEAGCSVLGGARFHVRFAAH